MPKFHSPLQICLDRHFPLHGMQLNSIWLVPLPKTKNHCDAILELHYDKLTVKCTFETVYCNGLARVTAFSPYPLNGAHRQAVIGIAVLMNVVTSPVHRKVGTAVTSNGLSLSCRMF